MLFIFYEEIKTGFQDVNVFYLKVAKYLEEENKI